MLDTWTLIEAVSLLVLLLLSAFFSGSETALISLNKIRVRRLMEKNVKNAFVIHRLLKHPNKMLATILVGNNLVNIAAASIATSLAINVFGSKGIGIAIGIMTFLVLVFGEITPKGFAMRNAERISLKIARPIEILVRILYPVVKVLTILTNPIIKAVGGEVKKLGPLVTEGEIKMLIDVGEEEGVIEKGEKEMIEGIFEFGETTVKEVLVPRIDMDCIDAEASFEEVLNLVVETGHSRIPIYEKSIDNIIGILHTKDLLKFLKEGRTDISIKETLKPAYFVPETKKLDDLLRELQRQKIHMAIVVDEYGGIAGLVTLEDLLEEIVGEIADEYDIEEAPLQRIDDRTAIVDAKMNIGEVNESLGIALPEGDFESVGGLIFKMLDKIPTEGEKIVIGNVTIIVGKMEGQRMAKVKIIKR